MEGPLAHAARTRAERAFVENLGDATRIARDRAIGSRPERLSKRLLVDISHAVEKAVMSPGPTHDAGPTQDPGHPDESPWFGHGPDHAVDTGEPPADPDAGRHMRSVPVDGIRGDAVGGGAVGPQARDGGPDTLPLPRRIAQETLGRLSASSEIDLFDGR